MNCILVCVDMGVVCLPLSYFGGCGGVDKSSSQEIEENDSGSPVDVDGDGLSTSEGLR